MTKEETAKIIAVIIATYPRNFATLSERQIDNMISAWARFLKEYTYDQANAALDKYIKTDASGFPPSVNQIISNMPPKRSRDYSAMMEELAGYERQHYLPG